MRCAIGQDSHRFDFENHEKRLVLGGVVFPDAAPLSANSDGDVVLHAITNAVSGITCVNILGKPADKLCQNGITDSSVYLKEALQSLAYPIVHLSVAIECSTPKITPMIPAMRENISKILGIAPTCVGITATTGEGLTAFGRGEGISVFCILTTE